MLQEATAGEFETEWFILVMVRLRDSEDTEISSRESLY